MKKNNRLLGIIAAVVIILAVIIVWRIQISADKAAPETGSTQEDASIDLTGYTNSGDVTIESASEIHNESGELTGYLVTLLSQSYDQSIHMEVALDTTGTLVQAVKVLDSNTIDSLITKESFLSQFSGLSLPLSLSDITYEDSSMESEILDNSTESTGNTLEESTGTQTTEDTDNSKSASSLKDGSYLAEEKDFDEEGFKDKVTVTVEGGKITELKWDAYNEDGELKSVLSADGAYEVEKGALTWQEQAVAAADFVIEHQGVDSIVINDDGSTDSISGVSIPVTAFVELTKSCLEQAKAASTDNAGNTLDSESSKDTDGAFREDGNGESLATSSTDLVNAFLDGLNTAGSFITDFVLAK